MKIHIENQSGSGKLIRARLRRLAERVLKEEGAPEGEVGVIFTDNQHLRELNRTYAKVDSVTDVLAFSMQEGKGKEFSRNLLGDVYISWDQAKEHAREYRVPIESELFRLVIHGLLHLLGYEHRGERSAQAMRKKEEHFLRWALKSGGRRRR